MRYSPTFDRADFDPTTWRTAALTPSADEGWWEVDIDALGLAEGSYEYEFLLDNGSIVAADPYADEITKFGGYRGVFHISATHVRVARAFNWAGEQPNPLPPNNQIVIYEMPVKWMASDPEENNSIVELGTFEKVVFEHLDYLVSLGINCIELLPIEDSSQTLDWGYGTRFYFAPDYDIGSSVDAKFFIKACHKRGVRVILDVVMNFFNPTCALKALALSWFSVPSGTDGRDDYSQCLFRFNTPAYGTYFAAEEFLCQMAEFWVKEYHIDGYRIDDFKDIQNWQFGQTFRERAEAASAAASPGKPFIVIAEDSDRRFNLTDNGALNGDRIFDGIWNFGYRDEIRKLLLDQIVTVFGRESRTVRVQHLLSKDGVWNTLGQGFLTAGFGDLANSVCYITSHDVADGKRLMNLILGSTLVNQGIGYDTVDSVRSVIDGPLNTDAFRGAVNFGLYRVFGAFALLLTSVGIPMFLAGEEFGDVHDFSFTDVDPKQQDPVQWGRAKRPGQTNLLSRLAPLIRLRTHNPALQRNEIDFFYFHPSFDDNGGGRVFGYARTAGAARGGADQVIVLANMGAQKYASYDVPSWPWRGAALTEIGNSTAALPAFQVSTGALRLSLDAFEARVFTT